MLYATTRNKQDAFPSQQTLRGKQAPDGGYYVPVDMKPLTRQQVEELQYLPFNQCVVQLLNYFFDEKLTTFDLEFAVGRRPVRTRALSQRIVMAECWRNTEWTFDGMVKAVVRRLTGETGEFGDWPAIAVRLAVLCGLFGELQRQELMKEPVDVAVTDFAGVMSLWYGRKWGLPIRNIVCACGEDNGLWELFHQEQTEAAGLPRGLERLVADCGGAWEVERFGEICRRGGVYTPGEGVLNQMEQGLHISVISQAQMLRTIPAAYATHKYLLAPQAAMGYAGLLDYRAKTGQNHLGLILADRSPDLDRETVAGAMGLTENQVAAMPL